MRLSRSRRRLKRPSRSVTERSGESLCSQLKRQARNDRDRKCWQSAVMGERPKDRHVLAPRKGVHARELVCGIVLGKAHLRHKWAAHVLA